MYPEFIQIGDNGFPEKSVTVHNRETGLLVNYDLEIVGYTVGYAAV